MFDGIVDVIVERIAPLLTDIGDSVCQSTAGLIARWPSYEFMCRNHENLAELTVEHIAITLIAMAIAVLLGVLIGVRVSSSPWPTRGSLWFWPVLGLAGLMLIAGILVLVLSPEEGVALEDFQPANLATWGTLFGGGGAGPVAIFVAVQAAAALALGVVLVAGFLSSGGPDWRILGAAGLGAVLGPVVVPRPILHQILLQVYRLAAMLPLGEGLAWLATVLNRVRDLAPLWAFLGMLLLIGRLTKQVNWRTLLAAGLGGYAVSTLVTAFVVTPGAESSSSVLKLLIFGLFAAVSFLGESAAEPTLYVVGVIFTIPSLAMFGIMIPIIGIGVDPAVAALMLYALLPILRNTITGLRELDPAYAEAGRGMGMTDIQLLTRVRLPLILPVILAGVRVSMVMTVGIASIATLIGAGGLGELIFQGIARTQPRMVLTGAIWISLLALAADFIMGRGETRWVSKGIQREADTAVQQEPTGA